MSRSPTYGSTRSFGLSKNVAIPDEAVIAPLPTNGFFSSRSLTRVGWILGIGGFSLITYYGIKYLLYGRGSADHTTTNEEVKGQPKVILHQCPRGFTVPSISPFPLKVETFLRVAQIPFEVDFCVNCNTEGRVPWLTVGNDSIFQIHDCIPLLSKVFEVNLEQSARPSRIQASRLVEVLLENQIYWSIALWRWVFDKGASIGAIQSFADESTVVAQISDSVKRAAKHNKIGRQSFEEVLAKITMDLSALQAALGKHFYFLGDTPGEIDCTAFAMLAQILWAMPNSPFFYELQKYPSLIQFVIRMRDEYWQDWNDHLAKPDQNIEFAYPRNEFDVPVGTDSEEAGSDSEWEEIEAEVSRRSTPRARSTPSPITVMDFLRSRSRSKASLATWENNNVLNQFPEVDNLHQLQSVKQILESLKLQDENSTEDAIPAEPTFTSTPAQTVLSSNGRPRTKQNLMDLTSLREQVDALAQALHTKTQPDAQSQVLSSNGAHTKTVTGNQVQPQNSTSGNQAQNLTPTWVHTPGSTLPFSQGQQNVSMGERQAQVRSCVPPSLQQFPPQGVYQGHPQGHPIYSYAHPSVQGTYFPTRSRPTYYLQQGVPLGGQMSRPDLNPMIVGGPMNYQPGSYYNDMVMPSFHTEIPIQQQLLQIPPQQNQQYLSQRK